MGENEEKSKNEDKKKEKKTRNLRREDKIFNNRYNQGEGLKDPNDYKFSTGIAVDGGYSSNYLKDLYDYENNVDYQIFLEHIFEIIKKDEILSNIIDEKEGTRNKFNKEEVNFLFERIQEILSKHIEYEKFSSAIYILEAISSITAMEYKKLFDFLNYSYKESLLTELNTKYKFLEGKMNKNNKLF
jgi:hypothetical protein